MTGKKVISILVLLSALVFTTGTVITPLYDPTALHQTGSNVSTGTYDFGGAASLELPNSDNPTTDAAGEIAIDLNDAAVEIFTAAASRLITSVEDKDALIIYPDYVNDEVYFMHVDADKYPHGIKLLNVQITLPADAAYSMVFEEWAGDPPAAQNDIETVTTGATDAYAEVLTTDIDDSDIDADSYIFLHVPNTDVGWVAPKVLFYAKEGD